MCGCANDTFCSYSGFVDVVQNATSRPASVNGSVLIRSGISVVSSIPISTPLLSASGNIV